MHTHIPFRLKKYFIANSYLYEWILCIKEPTGVCKLFNLNMIQCELHCNLFNCNPIIHSSRPQIMFIRQFQIWKSSNRSPVFTLL